MKEDTEILRIFIRESMTLQEDESGVGPGWGAITGTAELGYGLKALKFLGELYDAVKRIAIHGINMIEIFVTTLVNTGLAAAEGVSSTFGSKPNYDSMITNQSEMLRRVRMRSKGLSRERVDEIAMPEKLEGVQEIVSSVQADIDNVTDIFDEGSKKSSFNEIINYLANELDLIISPVILSLFTIEGMSVIEGREVTVEEFNNAQEELAGVVRAIIPTVLSLFLKEMSKSVVEEISGSIDFTTEEADALIPVIQTVYDSAM